MKNTFNEVIVDANCKSLNSEFSEITHHTQGGFVGGRNFLKNPVDIDASGRIYSCAYEGLVNSFNPSNIPISGAFDFEAAFPSVIHLWIWVVLHHRQMPGRFINLFEVIYKDAKAEYTHNGITYT